MSHYLDCQTEFRDQDVLIEALLKVGRARTGGVWCKSTIEVHDKPTNLFGFQGDVRPDKANIIIRRQNVGGMSNDIGFRKEENGTYTAVISDYDRYAYNDGWMSKLKQEYANAKLKKEYKRKGLHTKEERKADGTIRLTVRGFG